MTTTKPRAVRTVLRVARRAVLILLGVIVALPCYFVCQGMFSGYRHYGSNILSYVGLFLICATGGLAWIFDHRRISDDDD